MHMTNSLSDTVSVLGIISPLPTLEGILGSGNNVNVQIQHNSDNNIDRHSGDGNMYLYSPIFQGQSIKQDSSETS